MRNNKVLLIFEVACRVVHTKLPASLGTVEFRVREYISPCADRITLALEAF